MIRERKKETKTDTVLLILVLLLAVFGLVMLFSISEYNGRVRFGDSAYYFKKQLFATALGLMTMYIVAETDYRFFVRLAPAAYLLSMGLSTAVLFVGQEINGSRRWLNFGPLSFQPSEFAKAAVIAVFLAAESYRLERLAIWRNPEKYEKGFQTIQGLYAIGSGGLFGRGFGSSLQKLGFVPEAQNDMIFSIICEELGLTGAFFLIGIFGLLMWRLMVIALHCRELQGTLLCVGIMSHMAIQVILNIAVVTNTIPNTGITLPFISYGGTSVVFLLGEMGLALSVSRK